MPNYEMSFFHMVVFLKKEEDITMHLLLKYVRNHILKL